MYKRKIENVLQSWSVTDPANVHGVLAKRGIKSKFYILYFENWEGGFWKFYRIIVYLNIYIIIYILR